jgi:hypothetical protein
MGNETWTKNSNIELDQISKQYPVGKMYVTVRDSISPLVIPTEFLLVRSPFVCDKTISLNLMASWMRLHLPLIHWFIKRHTLRLAG